MENHNPADRINTSKAFQKSGDSGVFEQLFDKLRDNDCKVRNAAAEEIVELGNPKAIKPLTGLLSSHYISLRHTAAELLSTLGIPKWVSIFKGDYNDYHRLIKSGQVEAFDIIIKALDDENIGNIASASEALGKSGDTRAIAPLLKKAQNSSEWLIQDLVISSLKELSTYFPEIETSLNKIKKIEPPKSARIFKIGSSFRSPCVYFDIEQGLFLMRGNSFLELHIPLYNAIKDELELFNRKYPDKPLIASFCLGFYYTASSNEIYGLFRCLEKHVNTIVYWYYQEDDDNQYEIGDDWTRLIKLPFKFIEINDFEGCFFRHTKIKYEENLYPVKNEVQIEASEETPSIYFNNALGIIYIRGKSVTKKPFDLYFPVIEAIESCIIQGRSAHYEYIFEKGKQYDLIFEIEKCSGASIEYLQQILTYFNDCENVSATWICKKDNEDMLTLADELKAQINYKFEIIQDDD